VGPELKKSPVGNRRRGPRPAIRLGAGAAHQHCPLSVAQAVSPKEGLDRLLGTFVGTRNAGVAPFPEIHQTDDAQVRKWELAGAAWTGKGTGPIRRHWEILGMLIAQAPTAALLVVATYRPELTPPWQQRSHITPITLNRLERPEVEAMVGHLGDGRPLPGEVVDHIVAKADGVPLCVEELTKAILGSGVLEARGDAYVLTGALAQLHIPETLQDSLMARLDRAPRLREVAQLGSHFPSERDRGFESTSLQRRVRIEK
jgi:hypothetical protein